jgi:hypothetical protein
MELTRRTFIGRMICGCVGLAAGLSAAVGRVPAIRFLRARIGHFPGKVIPFDPKEVRRPGPWAG